MRIRELPLRRGRCRRQNPAVRPVAETLEPRLMLSFNHFGVAFPSYYAQDFSWPGNQCDYDIAEGPARTYTEKALEWLEADTHTNTIQIVPSWYYRQTDDPEPVQQIERDEFFGGHHYSRTATDEQIRGVIQWAHAHGWDVLLKPHVDPLNGGWRGYIDPSSDPAWFAEYQEFIEHYASLAAEDVGQGQTLLGVGDIFSVGCEYVAMSGQTQAWNDIITAVRGLVPADVQLTYAANWTEYTQVGFWGELDLIGIDAYFPLDIGAQQPTLENLKAALRVRADEICTWRSNNHATMDVLLTETGYRSVDEGHVDPGDHEFDPLAARNDALQQMCYQAVVDVWSEPAYADCIDGMLFWAVAPNISKDFPDEAGWHYEGNRLVEGPHTGFSVVTQHPLGVIAPKLAATVLGWGSGNTDPVAGDDVGTTDEDTPLTVPARGVLSNDTDADGDGLTAAAVQATSAKGAAVTVSPRGAFTYDPSGRFDALDFGESDTDTFEYIVRDGHGGTDTATVTITVNGVNDQPVLAVNVGAEVFKGRDRTIGAGLLAASDADNTAAELAYTLTALPGSGQLRLGGMPLSAGNTFTQADIDAGLLIYQHDGSATNTDGFEFALADGAGGGIGNTAFDITVITIQIGQGGAWTARYTEADDTRATACITAGSATLDFDGRDLTRTIAGGAVEIAGTDVHLVSIDVTDSAAHSSLIVHAFGGADNRAAVGGLTSATPLAVISAARVDFIDGGIQMTGDAYARVVVVGSLLNGADLIMPGQGAPGGIAIRAAELSDGTRIELGSYLASLVAWRWAGGGLIAPWAYNILFTGHPFGGVPGDFGADVTLTGAAPNGYALLTATIVGGILGGLWDLEGNVASIYVRGATAAAWRLDAVGYVSSLRALAGLGGGVKARYVNAAVTTGDLSAALEMTGQNAAGISLGALIAGAVVGDVLLEAVGVVNLIRVWEWQTGRIEAGGVNILLALGNAQPAVALAGHFGADVVLSAAGARRYTLGYAYVAGNLLSALWDITGAVGTLFVGHVLTPLDLDDVTSLGTHSPLLREMQGGVPVGLIAVEGADALSRIRFASLRQWPRALHDYASPDGPDEPLDPGDVLASLTLQSLKNRCVTSGLGRWTGGPANLRPGLLASYGRTNDPTYRFVATTAFVYDNALAIEALLQGDAPDAESLARAFQIADALVLLQDHDPISAGLGPDATFPSLTPAPLRDGYYWGVVASSRAAARVTVRSDHTTTSSGNQAYVASALLTAADAAADAGDAARAADYLRTAKELLLYVGRARQAPDPLRGFHLSNHPAYGTVRACEHSIDLTMAFGRLAQIEQDPDLRTKWEEWRDWADHFRDQMYGPNERFPTLAWISDGWQYFRAGTGLADDINKDLVPTDTGAWSSLQVDDDRDVAFNLLTALATSTDAGGRTYTGFDPGFRAVIDPDQDSNRDGVGTEVTAYMALIARKLGDAAVLAQFPARDALCPQEQWACDVLTAAADGGTDHDLADYLVARLADIQLHAPNGDQLGLVAAPVRNVGTGEYELVNGWSLASTCWARAAYQGWSIFTHTVLA